MASSNPSVFYRLYAAECVEIAQLTQDPARKAKLLTMGQAWLALADQADKNNAAPTLVYVTPEPQRSQPLEPEA
jgi:hypothetical protein